MAQNILILCGADGAAAYAAELAARSGSDIGLIDTSCDLEQLRRSGGRIEVDRDYGGRVLSAFDEPLGVGSAVAQLAGHADAVVVDRLDVWAARLVSKYAEEPDSIAAELNSLRSVMKAQLLDLLLIAVAPDDAPGPAAELARRILADLGPLCQVVVDMAGGAPRVMRGELPG